MWTFYFGQNDEENPQKVIVHVSIDRDLGVLKFDVDLDSLPPIYLNGTEMVVNFEVADFDNNSTFFTDSNGLGMLERKLSYRPTWNFDLNLQDSNENITGNYYPVDSAITMFESKPRGR